MPILIKTSPLSGQPQAGSVVRITENAYGSPVFGRGEEAFIWIDGDGKGGEDSRLYATGMVLEEPIFDNPGKSNTPVKVKVVLSAIEPEKDLRYARDIRPHRDDPTNRVMHGLAEIICRNSHKKVTMLDREQASILRSRFATQE